MGLFDKIFGTNPQTPNQQTDGIEEPRPTEPVESKPMRRYPKHPRNYGDSKDSCLMDVHRLDPMFADVARYVVAKQDGSTSRLQRAFEIGYNRAGKLSDQLEMLGITGPNKGVQGREVYIKDMDSLENLLKCVEARGNAFVPNVPRPDSEMQAEQFIHLRTKVVQSTYDSLLLDVIRWIVDEELFYSTDLIEEFGIDYNRAQEITYQLVEIGVLKKGVNDEEYEVQVVDGVVAEMLCEYIYKHCSLQEYIYDITDDFENIKRQIKYEQIKELDSQFEDAVEWLILRKEFTVTDLIKQFGLSTLRAVDLIDQLSYAQFVCREDISGKGIYKVLVRNPELATMVCQNIRDYVCGYIELPIVEETSSTEIVPNTEVCYVYLMHDKSNGFYKIGISKDPQYRERTLQSEKPTIEKICAKEFPTRPIAEAIESALHKSYGAKRLRGEWFNLDEADVINIIKTLS